MRSTAASPGVTALELLLSSVPPRPGVLTQRGNARAPRFVQTRPKTKGHRSTRRRVPEEEYLKKSTRRRVPEPEHPKKSTRRRVPEEYLKSTRLDGCTTLHGSHAVIMSRPGYESISPRMWNFHVEVKSSKPPEETLPHRALPSTKNLLQSASTI